MQFSLSIKTGSILSQGISSELEQLEWASRPLFLDDNSTGRKLSHIPMMQARRMSKPTALACESFLSIVNEYPIDAAVFLSEHGELERSHKIIKNIIEAGTVSPIDFSMSVHNAAAGLATILSEKNIEVSSISAGKNGLFQSLYEVLVLLESGAEHVLLVAFDGGVPDFYLDYGVQTAPTYAVSLLFTKGDDWQISVEDCDCSTDNHYPLPIELMHGVLSKQRIIALSGNFKKSLWKYHA